MNNQPPEKKVSREDGILEVHSIFYTIQGEGPFAGRSAIFIRLAGCNLDCPQCDTDYTGNRFYASSMSLLDLVNEYERPGSLVVITGGEPFRQNLAPTVDLLLDAGYLVQIETNGTLYQDLPFHKDLVIVCSPKTGSINKQLVPHVAALKYVVNAGDIGADDGLPNHALGHSAEPRLARPPHGWEGIVYIQPEDSKDDNVNQANLGAAIRSAMNHGYTLGLQIHKHISME